MDGELLFSIFIFLAAASITVPVVNRLRLGSVIGYLVAGILIGPFGLKLIANPEQVMHFAEFGVVMMLFLIGLELDPSALWRLRKSVLGLGGLQVAATSLLLTVTGTMLGYAIVPSLICGMALALSSTALVLQILQEKGLLQTEAGESAFSVLLFQDMAVIPILLVIPLLAGVSAPVDDNLLSGLPAALQTVIVVSVIAFIVIGGKYLSYPLFRFVARTNLRELFTATSLALVVGVTLLMEAIGVSAALGAFIAGVVLANSEYRHTLETDIQPFKGLLLGLFFISVGMGMNFMQLGENPLGVFSLLLLLIAGKALILFVLGYAFGLRDGQNVLFTLLLAQGSEFAFVLFQYASNLGILSGAQLEFLTLIVALSMAATPFLMMFNDRFIIPRFMSRLPEREYDAIHENNPVIIAGYGRFGQIIGRFLVAQGINVTILEKDPEQIELLRKFGNRGYFGDASRLDILRNAGADKARLLVIAIDDADKCLEIVHMAKEHFPNLTLFARARNRRHAYELYKAGVYYFRREMFDSSLTMAQEVATFLGIQKSDAAHKAQQFMKHDEITLHQSFAFFEREPELIHFARQASGELERILRADNKEDK